MMINRFLITILFLLLICSHGGAKNPPPPPAPTPTAAQQQSFMEEFFKAVDGGNKAYAEWENKIRNMPGGEEGNLQNQMLNNMEEGKAPDGSKLKGFRGDPTDQGPLDTSEWDVQTDADGNVTGIGEKDFKEKDADGDGEISDAERSEWDKKKKAEHDAAGGPPGEVETPPDWDKDNDGKPDPGFDRDCWQCVMPKDMKCMDGITGDCPGTCQSNQQCFPHKETIEGQTIPCHTCGPKEEIVPFCEACGHSSDPACGGRCPAIACVPLDIDKKTCDIIGTMKTRERDSTMRCYGCMKIKRIEITIVIVIIETPYGRFVLKKTDKSPFSLGDFVPGSIMSFASQDSLQGLLGQSIGMISSQAMSLDGLSGMLTQGLSKGGAYGQNCFDKDFKAADMPKTPPPQPEKDKKAKKSKKDKSEPDAPAQPLDFGNAPAQGLVPDGPMVGCGNIKGEKALQVYDAHGRVVETVTQAQAKKDPEAVKNALMKAQDMAQTVMSLKGQGLPGLAKYAVQMVGEKVVGKVKEKVKEKIKGKGKKEPEAPPVEPNDPLYIAGPEKKSKKLLGIIGSSVTPKVDLNGIQLLKSPEEADELDVKDQWGLRTIGYLPKSDPSSAWNLVDSTKPNVLVAVIDSGIDLSHPDGPEFLWMNPKEIPDNKIDDDNNGYVDDVHGYNFLDDDSDLTDLRGHGTIVTGIIAARTNNGIGIAGINPGAIIMPLKVANNKGETNSFNIHRAIHYAVNQGARVINISMGNREVSRLEEAAINYAMESGVFVAVASGNVNENIGNHGPAADLGAYAVGAIDYAGNRSTVSNWGPNNGLLAPGEQILSTFSKDAFDRPVKDMAADGYKKESGTSFSTPMVAATVSLMLTKNPKLTNREIEDILYHTATNMYEDGWDGMSGAGLLNATAALKADAGEYPVVKIDRIRINKDNHKNPESVDILATVRGPINLFSVEVGKGKRASQFKEVAGPYAKEGTHAWVAHILVDEDLRGNDEWIVRVKAKGKDGKDLYAQTLLQLK